MLRKMLFRLTKSEADKFLEYTLTSGSLMKLSPGFICFTLFWTFMWRKWKCEERKSLSLLTTLKLKEKVKNINLVCCILLILALNFRFYFVKCFIFLVLLQSSFYDTAHYCSFQLPHLSCVNHLRLQCSNSFGCCHLSCQELHFFSATGLYLCSS